MAPEREQAPVTEQGNEVNRIGINFYTICGIDEKGECTTEPGVGYYIYDDFEQAYDFSTYKTLEEMVEAINPDTVIPFIIDHFPGYNADKKVLRNYGCYLNGTFIDAQTYNHKHYPLYVMPTITSYNDLGTAPVEPGSLVAAIYREDEPGGTITLRVRECAQIQYKGVVYSTPSKYPVTLFKPLSDSNADTEVSEMKVQKKNVFEVFRETEASKTSMGVIKEDKIPRPSELFNFLFEYIDNY